MDTLLAYRSAMVPKRKDPTSSPTMYAELAAGIFHSSSQVKSNWIYVNTKHVITSHGTSTLCLNEEYFVRWGKSNGLNIPSDGTNAQFLPTAYSTKFLFHFEITAKILTTYYLPRYLWVSELPENPFQLNGMIATWPIMLQFNRSSF